jgi:hypothetical protein
MVSNEQCFSECVSSAMPYHEVTQHKQQPPHEMQLTVTASSCRLHDAKPVQGAHLPLGDAQADAAQDCEGLPAEL